MRAGLIGRPVFGWIPLLLLGVAGSARAEYGVNFPEPASQGAREIYDVHMLTFWIATVLMVIVTGLVAYSVWKHRRSRGFEADARFHEGWFGRWGWVSVPVLVLGVDLTIATSANPTLVRLWHPPADVELDVKVTGHQWWWEYEYLDHGVTVESRAAPQEIAGDNYLREVDNPLVLPVGTKVRFLHTSADVLHAFWVPALGFKKDAIPGYITETWTEIDREGVFRGQCAELCGTWHARMPIVVKAVSRDAFDLWVRERRAEAQRAAEEADPTREWSRDELMARGEQTYVARCAACHMANGEGMPPAFPPLKGSKAVLGPVEDHVGVIINGVPGTAMQSWARLNDLEIAALVTYERNAWGGGTGELIQPARIAAVRSESQSAAR